MDIYYNDTIVSVKAGANNINLNTSTEYTDILLLPDGVVPTIALWQVVPMLYASTWFPNGIDCYVSILTTGLILIKSYYTVSGTTLVFTHTYPRSLFTIDE